MEIPEHKTHPSPAFWESVIKHIPVCLSVKLSFIEGLLCARHNSKNFVNIYYLFSQYWVIACSIPGSIIISSSFYWIPTVVPCILLSVIIQGGRFYYFFLNIYILLKHSWLTMLQVHSSVIQLYIYTHIIFEIIFYYGLGVQNEAGQRPIEFCQENTLVIANTLFQQHKRRLYRWTSPDGQHWNQIDYILCSQRWRPSIQSAKTRLGADCGPDHELFVAKFRLKLKKVEKTTRPFRYDLNQIPYDYIVEVRNRFKGLVLIDRVPDELWMEVHDIIQETGIQTTPKKNKCEKAKWLSEEALQIAVKK